MTTPGTDAERAFRRALTRAAPALARPLPWIGHRDPWAVLVSEVMLQQTSTSRVVAPWTAFMDRFATPADCARAPLAEVLRLWGGLGYPRRARSLHAAARAIRDDHGGVVPSSIEELRRLPGVGDYTAAAVASFAFGQRVAVLDTNVGRVLARAVSNATLTPAQARAVASRLLPRRGSAAFNQAMIDLGATVCRSRPRCDDCPVARACRWRREGGEDPATRSAGVSRRQKPYEGSDRQVRGRVLAHLRAAPSDLASLARALDDVAEARLRAVLGGLDADGLVAWSATGVALEGDAPDSERTVRGQAPDGVAIDVAR
ncbi:MAG: A/G-specific adenine glycosylase [Acidobacteriota bacterium]|nr:A/G-specific adenine glycosylase [Acidobacteriota bacterium]